MRKDAETRRAGVLLEDGPVKVVVFGFSDAVDTDFTAHDYGPGPLRKGERCSSRHTREQIHDELKRCDDE